MSEQIPESIPTSRNWRPVKKQKVTAVSEQAKTVEALFAKPDKEIIIPSAENSAVANLRAPPEIVSNVQGSSAGAGSGEFHVYKASRRREYERLRAMDEEVEKEKEDEAYERERLERLKRDQEATEKKRRKREKLKMKKGKGGKASGNGEDTESGAAGVKPSKVLARSDAVDTDTAPGAVSGNGEAPAQVEEEQGLIIHDDD